MNGLLPNDLIYFGTIVFNINKYVENSDYINDNPNTDDIAIFKLHPTDYNGSFYNLKLPETKLINNLYKLKPTELIENLSSYTLLKNELTISYTKVYNLDSLMIFYKHFLPEIKITLNKLAKYNHKYLNYLVKIMYKDCIVNPLNNFYIEFSKKHTLLNSENDFISPLTKNQIKRSISMYLKNNYVPKYEEFIFSLAKKDNFKEFKKPFLNEDLNFNVTNQSLYLLYILFFKDNPPILERNPSSKELTLTIISEEFGGNVDSLIRKNEAGKIANEYLTVIRKIFNDIFELN